MRIVWQNPIVWGLLYWQLNDCWSGISWSSIDYYGNWKASHYAIKEAFAPIIPIISVAKDSFQLAIVSDKIANEEISYQIDIQNFEGKKLLSFEEKTSCQKFSYKKMAHSC